MCEMLGHHGEHKWTLVSKSRQKQDRDREKQILSKKKKKRKKERNHTNTCEIPTVTSAMKQWFLERACNGVI